MIRILNGQRFLKILKELKKVYFEFPIEEGKWMKDEFVDK